MKNKSHQKLLPEYDFSKGTRGKYAKQFAAGTNIIVLAPDVAKQFPNSDVVNDTLRAVAMFFTQSKKHIPA